MDKERILSEFAGYWNSLTRFPNTDAPRESAEDSEIASQGAADSGRVAILRKETTCSARGK